MKIELVTYDEKFLKLSWKWLRNKETKFLTKTSSFTKKQQLAWFSTLKQRSDYKAYRIEVEKDSIGVAGLKHIKDHTAFVFSIIGEKEYRGKGIGDCILQLIFDKAKELEIKTLFAEIIVENIISINFFFRGG